MYTLVRYTTPSGRDPMAEWLDQLRDRSGRRAVLVRLARAEAGNLGDHKPVGNGVFELRIHSGPGYRVYYAQEGKAIILLLAGGDKSTQRQNIQTAILYFREWNTR